MSLSIGPADPAFVRETLTDAFGSTMMAIHGALIDARGDGAAAAYRDGYPIALLTYRDDGAGGWEVLSLVSIVPGAGAGTALLDWLAAEAHSQAVHRLWLITTNENINALAFYQRRGWNLTRLDEDAVTRARSLKPTIPLESGGIPIRHELELELNLR
ncbi:GNAT family N-acetyltransferase [Actinoplanes couchii]|nr:GNAT family N-acetyltransferase [Actinoplanes couchii]MDR6317046.1 GNAT superfamily N-acetyltransferase [Actinoplanes couchii]